MTSYLVRYINQGAAGRYLEIRPYDGALTWLAPFERFATPFTEAEALGHAAHFALVEGLETEVIPDPLGRRPVHDAQADAEEVEARR